MRRVVVVLLVLVGLLVIVDRAAVRFAQTRVASELQRSADLPARPAVTIDGVPFLTQAVKGRYDRIELAAEEVQGSGVRLTHLRAVLTDVQVPLQDALRGEVGSIPVGGVTATALVPYADLARSSGVAGARLVLDHGRLLVSGRLDVLGRRITATAVSQVVLHGRSIAVTAQSLTVPGVSPRALNFLVPLGTLPYGLSVTGLELTKDGVRLQARCGPTVLRA